MSAAVSGAQAEEPSLVPLPGIGSLLDQLDKRVMIILRDGKNLVGVLRSFDQYMNLVLETACERAIAEGKYSDFDLGFLIIRGDDIVVLAEIDDYKEEHEMPLTKVSNETILEAEQDMANDKLVWDFES